MNSLPFLSAAPGIRVCTLSEKRKSEQNSSHTSEEAAILCRAEQFSNRPNVIC
jgi:hypothetical protein